MKIIDILNKIAEGTLADGVIVEYNENLYLYDKNDNTLINSREEEFSFNVMVEEHLNDEVKLYKKVENMKKKEINSGKFCSICHKEYTEYGNNAQPINDGWCCDECNKNIVIPARIQMNMNQKKIKERLLQ